MMLTGKTIRTDKAKKMGLVDQVVDAIGKSSIKSIVFPYLEGA